MIEAVPDGLKSIPGNSSELCHSDEESLDYGDNEADLEEVPVEEEDKSEAVLQVVLEGDALDERGEQLSAQPVRDSRAEV